VALQVALLGYMAQVVAAVLGLDLMGSKAAAVLASKVL
jgi:hypothetical protein